MLALLTEHDYNRGKSESVSERMSGHAHTCTELIRHSKRRSYYSNILMVCKTNCSKSNMLEIFWPLSEMQWLKSMNVCMRCTYSYWIPFDKLVIVAF